MSSFASLTKPSKLTPQRANRGLGIADKSFSPMETAFRRGQYLLNTVAEHDLEDETHAIDTIGEVFTNIHAETTVDELYNANDCTCFCSFRFSLGLTMLFVAQLHGRRSGQQPLLGAWRTLQT